MQRRAPFLLAGDAPQALKPRLPVHPSCHIEKSAVSVANHQENMGHWEEALMAEGCELQRQLRHCRGGSSEPVPGLGFWRAGTPTGAGGMDGGPCRTACAQRYSVYFPGRTAHGNIVRLGLNGFLHVAAVKKGANRRSSCLSIVRKERDGTGPGSHRSEGRFAEG